MGIGFDNVSGGELSGFFSCGSSNMLMGSRESNLVSLGVGWEDHSIFVFPPLVSGSYSMF